MSAKGSDLARIQEIWDVGVQTQNQIASLGFTRNRFLEPQSDVDDLIGEGIMNRVLRITEEAGESAKRLLKNTVSKDKLLAGFEIGWCMHMAKWTGRLFGKFLSAICPFCLKHAKATAMIKGSTYRSWTVAV